MPAVRQFASGVCVVYHLCTCDDPKSDKNCRWVVPKREIYHVAYGSLYIKYVIKPCSKYTPA